MDFPPSIAVTEHLDLAEQALEGDPRALQSILEMLRSPDLVAALRSRGASDSEATDLIADLMGDCFGGERAKGGLHRLLERYNGSCPLPAFLRHVALHRLIDLKRKQAKRKVVTARDDDDEDPLANIAAPGGGADEPADTSVVTLLREAITRTFASVEPEKLVLYRLVHSYGVPQKQVGALWGMPEWTISRKLDSLRDELQRGILAEIRRRDAWLELEWEDLMALCSESVELFG
jgi:RNA polymerase sigma factor (sigma-70 family)